LQKCPVRQPIARGVYESSVLKDLSRDREFFEEVIGAKLDLGRRTFL
jgi:hypothetical protein